MDIIVNMKRFLSLDFYRIDLYNLGAALIIFAIVLFLLKLVRGVILNNLKRLAKYTKAELANIFVEHVEKTPKSFDWILSFFVAFHFIRIPNQVVIQYYHTVFLILISYRVIMFTNGFLDSILENSFAKTKKEAKRNHTALFGIKVVIKVILWTSGILLILANLGLKITTLIASFGIGGIAIGFASQKILADLFSSFAIYFDRPFEINDFIKVGDDMGEVMKIGLKTTRIKTLRGEELVVSNAELLDSRIQNLERMRKRRTSFVVGVEYSTTLEQLKKIPSIIEKIVKETKKTEFIRCYFTTFGAFSLDFETVYYVLSGDYEDYLIAQQRINLSIKEIFETEKIGIAFPTQTLYFKQIGS